MRCHSEALFEKLCWPDISLGFDENVEDTIANFADKMLIALDQRIEMLEAAEHQDLQFF